jgi:spore germination protein GerM
MRKGANVMKKTFTLLLCSTILIFNFSLTACDRNDTLSTRNNEKEKNIVFSNQKNDIVELNVYFNSTRDGSKVEVSKEPRSISKDELLAETIVNELIKGPSVKSRLYPVLNNNTRVISLSIKDNIAYLNLSKEANENMSPEKEETCIKSIVLSLTQLSSIHKVKIYINNSDRNLFGGNFDLSKPIGKNDLDNLNVNEK